jgi:excisionase family DNA binding protein
MPRSIYPNSSPTPLPPLPGQGTDNFAPFSSDRLLTTEEAAALLRVEPRTLAKFITSDRPNRLKASFIGRRWIILESSLRDFVKGQQTSD